MSQEQNIVAIDKLLAATGIKFNSRQTTYFKATHVGREGTVFYIELQVDAAGQMSHSTNLPPDIIRQYGKGLMWTDLDERYLNSLELVIEEMKKL